MVAFGQSHAERPEPPESRAVNPYQLAQQPTLGAPVSLPALATTPEGVGMLVGAIIGWRTATYPTTTSRVIAAAMGATIAGIAVYGATRVLS